MIGFSLFAMTLVMLAMLTVVCMVATREALQPVTVNPFGCPRPFDPSAETLGMDHHAAVTLAGDWHSIELDNLSEVEDLLDTLEAAHAHGTELELISNNKFAVRWR